MFSVDQNTGDVLFYGIVVVDGQSSFLVNQTPLYACVPYLVVDNSDDVKRIIYTRTGMGFRIVLTDNDGMSSGFIIYCSYCDAHRRISFIKKLPLQKCPVCNN